MKEIKVVKIKKFEAAHISLSMTAIVKRVYTVLTGGKSGHTVDALI